MMVVVGHTLHSPTYKSEEEPVSRSVLNRAFEILDAIRRYIEQLDGPPVHEKRETAQNAPAIQRATSSSEAAAARQSVRVEIAVIDQLLEAYTQALAWREVIAGISTLRGKAKQLVVDANVGDQVSNVNGLHDRVEHLAESIAQLQRALKDRADRVVREIDEARTLASKLRLVPAEV